MKIRNGLALLAVLVIGIVFGYTVCSYVDFQKSVAAMNERLMIQERLRIVSPYENVDSRGMPAVIPLSDEQRSYVIEVLSAMIRVIAGSTPLELEERMYLGTGQFYWPKNPDEPVRLSKSYFGEHFRMAGIAANVNRKSENSPWTRFSASVHPRNFPLWPADPPRDRQDPGCPALPVRHRCCRFGGQRPDLVRNHHGGSHHAPWPLCIATCDPVGVGQHLFPHRGNLRWDS